VQQQQQPAGAPPAGNQPPPANVVADTTPPLLRLARSRAQRVLRQNGLKVSASADEDSVFSARATINLPGRTARSVRLTGARTRTRARRAKLTLRLPRRQRAAVVRALKRRRSLKAVVTVTARNEAGLTRTRRQTVKLIR
jgi:hypothetical protein